MMNLEIAIANATLLGQNAQNVKQDTKGSPSVMVDNNLQL